MNQEAKALLDEVTGFYLNSGDFNGIPARQLPERLSQPWQEIRSIALDLIGKELLGILDDSNDVNPAINRIGFGPTEVQLKKLEHSHLGHTYVYPLPAHLKFAVDPSDYVGRPYTLKLALGERQFSFRSFELSVLESYRNDPRYMYENRDIDGFISTRNEFYQSDQMPEKDQILLESFGFSYDGNVNRAVAVFFDTCHV